MRQDIHLDTLPTGQSEDPYAAYGPTTLTLPWPQPGNPAGLLMFSSLEQWREFVGTLDLHPVIPATVGSVYRRAQRLFLMAWSDTSMFKVAELVALAALEAALNDRYGAPIRQPYFD